MAADRKALLDEFNTIVGPQKAALSSRLPHLFQQYYAPPHDLATSSVVAVNGLASQPSKRPLEHAQQEIKRVKSGIHPDSGKELDAFFKEVANLISKKLWSRKEVYPFKEPVDIVKNKIPDYHLFVPNPMDLGTVKNKLAKREYKTPLEACEDVRLVFRNCASYNQLGSFVRNAGDTLAEVWERAWQESRIEERWAEIMMVKDPSGCGVPLRVSKLNNQLKSALNLVPAQQQPTDTMSDVQKRKLSIQLAELPVDQLPGLLALIQEDLPASASDDEIELDLDALSTTTLLKMQSYVTNAAAVSRPGNMSAPNKQAPTPDGRSMGHAQAGPHAQHSGEDDAPVAGSSGQTSPAVSADSQEVKGSTMDDPHGKAPFVMSSKANVDESATAPKESSSILRDRTAARKPDVHVNAANWDVTALQPETADPEQEMNDDEDEMWVNFKSKEEQKRQQAEEQRRLKEQQEEEIRKAKDAQAEEARRALSEAEEREKALQAEEARLQAEQQRARMEQCDKEVDEIKARQGTANLVQRDDMQGLAQVQPNEGDLAAVGLTYRNDDDDVNFDDE